MTPAIHPPARLFSMFLQFIKTPIYMDARPFIFLVFIAAAWSSIPSHLPVAVAAIPWRPMAPPTVIVDTVSVTIPADSLTDYILAEMRKVEAKMQSDCLTVDSGPNPFQIALFELYRREGYVPTAYRCPAGLETIGIGDVIDTPAERALRTCGMPFSYARAKVYANLKTGADEIHRRFPGKYAKPNEWLSLAMLGHSIGWGRLEAKYPDFYREIKSGRPTARWLKYCRYRDGRTKAIKRSTNLVRTRRVEWLLFTGNYPALHPLQVDAEKIAKKRWDDGRRLSLQKLGRE